MAELSDCRGSATTFGGLALKYLKEITIMRRISIIKSEIIKSCNLESPLEIDNALRILIIMIYRER